MLRRTKSVFTQKVMLTNGIALPTLNNFGNTSKSLVNGLRVVSDSMLLHCVKEIGVGIEERPQSVVVCPGHVELYANRCLALDPEVWINLSIRFLRAHWGFYRRLRLCANCNIKRNYGDCL